MGELVRISNLDKVYNGVKVVNNASFIIEKGKIYGLLGPNGAGKTTIMKLITNMIKKDGGNISYSDDVSIKYLMDVPVFYEYMRVEEFLNMLLDINKIENKEERLMYLLDISGLHVHKNKYIKNLSRGLRQKLGIASVLVDKVDLLILDEPISALDPIGRKEVLDIITSLRGEVAVIFSSHILNDIEKVCDNVILINKGKIILDSSCDSLFNGQHCLLAQCDNRENVLKLKELYPESNFSMNYENTLEIIYENLNKTQSDLIKNAKKLKIDIIRMQVKNDGLEEVFLRSVMGNE